MISELAKTLARLPRSVIAYDLETSGLNPAYDQIFQIAALRTDHFFCDPVDNSSVLELRARRQPWIVPSPTAMIVTRMDPVTLSSGLYHHNLLKETEAFFRAQPSIHMSYNGLRFDEHFLRHALFRSLCKPYLTQTNGSTRADLMVMAQAISVLEPEALMVPKNEAGRSTFRLGMLCRANGIEFSDDVAHDALADVRATLALARYLKSAAALPFDLTLALANKEFASSVLRPGKAFYRVAVFGGVPSVRAFVVIDHAEDDRNCCVCIDLTADPIAYLSSTADDLSKWLSKRLSPIALIKINAHEMVFPLTSHYCTRLHRLMKVHPSAERPPDIETLQSRASMISADLDFVDRVQDILDRRKSALEPPLLVDEQLYSHGFAADADFRICQSALALTSLEDRLMAIRSVSDARLREFAVRVLHEEGLGLDDRTACRIVGWQRERLLGPHDSPWRTITAARLEIEKMKSDQKIPHAELSTIEAWLDEIEAEASPVSMASAF